MFGEVKEFQGDEGGRSLTPKGLATRDRIVAAAASLMFDHGVAGTTTEDVQKAAGVGASQMYHYFADRRELIRAVIARQTQAVLASQQPFLGALDSIEAIRAWRDLFVDLEHTLECKGGCPLGSLADELAEVSAAYRKDLAKGFSQWEGAIRDGIGAMCSRGELPRDADPDQLALALLAAVQGGLLLTKVRRNTAPLEAVLDAMIDYLESLTPSPRARRTNRRRRPNARSAMDDKTTPTI
jgi:TetR/AcrR family transcriptional regulator, transcriptional repressor for nem operon